MSENEASKTAMQIASTLATDIYKDGLQPSVQSIGEALAGIFKAIGHYPRYWGMMSDISLEQKQQQFKEKLEAKVAAIPDDKKVLPKPNILGPSIQALEYGIFEDHLSEMFANLIASSMNSDKSSKTHPSYVEIIKQITSDEAKLIKYMSTKRLLPIVNLNRQTEKESTFTILEYKYHLISNFAGCEFPENHREMLENLERLKLVEVELREMGQTISDEGIYSVTKEYIEKSMNISVLSLDGKYEPKKPGDYFLTLGYMQISAFGKQFVEVCTS